MREKTEQQRLMEIIKRKILARYPSIRKFSLDSGFSYSLLSKLLSGKARINLEHLTIISRALGLPVYDLLSEEPLLPLSEYQKMLPEVKKCYRLVPRVSPASCGTAGIIPSSEIEDWLAFKEDFLRKFHQPIVTVAVGESMEPLIYNGDVLLIDRNEEKRLNPSPSGLYLVNFPETSEEIAITVKRIAISGEKLFLIPINPNYPVQAVDLKERSILDTVVGEVVWIGREIQK